MDVLIVGIGGVMGSLSRYALGRYFAEKAKNFPIGTFIINITGAILLGFVNSLKLPSPLQNFFAIGFLGAYTTFSSFMYESFKLFEGRKIQNAFIYIILSIMLGVPSIMLGGGIGRFLVNILH